MSRDTLIEAVVIGATAGLFAAGVNIAARYTSDPGDILGFIGGAAGAGAAVVGGLWLEQRKADESVRARIDTIARMLLGLATRSHNVLTIEGPRQLTAIRTLRQTIGTFGAQRAGRPLDDPEAQALLDTFAEGLDDARNELLTLEARIESGDMSSADAVDQLRLLLVGTIRSVAVVFSYEIGWPVACRAEADALSQHYTDAMRT